MDRIQVPNCPIHLGTPMKLVKSSAPLFVFISQTSHGKARTKEADGRQIWRCSVVGCPRVESEDLRMS